MAWQFLTAAVSFTASEQANAYQQKQNLRDAREQQALNNAELIRHIGLEQRAEKRPASERRLAYGGAGLRGGSATAATAEADAGQQLRYRQEELARQINVDLQDKRTKKLWEDQLKNYWKNTYGGFWDNTYGAGIKEVERFGKKANKEFNRLKKRLGL